MQKQSEMSIEQIEKVLENVDWDETHKLRVFSDYGASVVIYTDGTLSVLDQGTYYRNPDEAGVLGYLRCWGQGNTDRTAYSEGWCERVEHSRWVTEDEDRYVFIHVADGSEIDGGDWIEIETGRVLTTDEMLTEAIDYGAWEYDEEKEHVLRSIMEERDYQAMLREEAPHLKREERR